jgi:DNA segregation ATPase FtsK/SpoIIIE, S-DNA-T family
MNREPDDMHPSPGDGFDWDQALADVVRLDKGRVDKDRVDKAGGLPAPRGRDRDASDERDHLDDADDSPSAGDEAGEGDDAESIETTRVVLGGDVDPPDEPAQGWAARKAGRAPIIPAWLRTRAQALTAAKYALNHAGYTVAFHVARSPKYAGKTALYAPLGLARCVGKLARWASAEEGNWGLRQHAASRNDADTWLKLDRTRQAQARWRWWLVGALALALVVLAILVRTGVVGAGWVVLAVLGLLPVFARFGRPADRPITDRVSEVKPYRKLTADLVRRALLSIGISGINQAVAKNPAAISFPTEIHRDGPGHLAIVDLPHGVEAAEVCARRGRLASGLRLPMDQVWPEPVPRAHTGRLALWVGYEPASAMKQPPWPLLREAKVDVFRPFPFATDPRLAVVKAELMERNWLFGGRPGSGKTFALRLLALAAALDVRVELRMYNLKGTGDFKALEPVCTEYGNGFDDDTIARAAAMLDWLYAECQRRAKRIDHYAAIGKAPENKVIPELASLSGSGLHPLVVVIDEVQELFRHPRHGKDAGEVAEKVIKLGRAMGVVLILGTQIPDKDSLPTGVTRNVNTRFCLSVADQVANDMILGTSAYKLGYRATVFEPGVEAGWGILAGIGKPGARRSFYVDNADAAKVMARAIAARTAAGVMPDPPTVPVDARPAYDVLTDVATVWPAGEDAVWNETLIERLTELRPDVYPGWQPVQLTAALSTYGVPVGQIGRRLDGGKTINRRGPTWADVTDAITRRNRGDDPGGPVPAR